MAGLGGSAVQQVKAKENIELDKARGVMEEAKAARTRRITQSGGREWYQTEAQKNQAQIAEENYLTQEWLAKQAENKASAVDANTLNALGARQTSERYRGQYKPQMAQFATLRGQMSGERRLAEAAYNAEKSSGTGDFARTAYDQTLRAQMATLQANQKYQFGGGGFAQVAMGGLQGAFGDPYKIGMKQDDASELQRSTNEEIKKIAKLLENLNTQN